jgi:shikimate dehydrogenase
MPSDALLSDLRSLVSNDLPARLPGTVAFIIGANPSKGARSPKLWNAAFAALGIDGEMFPLDVTTENLAAVLHVLEGDLRVVGAAVAAPSKTDVACWLGERVTPVARRSGSVNLLARGVDGLFDGYNTDGLGALAALREVTPTLESKSVLVLGCGGTGRAVVSALQGVLADPKALVVANRSDSQRQWVKDVGAVPISWQDLDSEVSQFDVVINCTTVGWGAQADLSPLTTSQLSRLRHGTVVFDVIYQPVHTKLLQQAELQGLRCLGGGRMNLLQAVTAFMLAYPSEHDETVEAAMEAASRVSNERTE